MGTPSAPLRRLPVASVLSSEQIQTVHERSLAVLERTGILIEHPRALSLLAEAGAEVDFSSHLVKIPGSLVETCLKNAPSQITITGRKPEFDLVLSPDHFPRARSVLSLDWIVDAGQKQRRAVTVHDLENWVRLGQALPNLSLVSGIYPWDVPTTVRDVRAAQAMIEFSDKPILIAPFRGEAVHWISEMLSVLPDQRPGKLIVFSSCNSPLIYSESQMDVLLEAAANDLPVMVNSSAVTGATAPVTLAGTLVVMNAEILAGITVAILTRPGAKVIYCGHPVFLDMRTGAASCGHTEAGLLQAALVDLGRSYHLPTGSNGLTTDSHTLDEQAAAEKLISGWLALQSGASLNGGAGSLAAVGTCSLEQLVIDDDLYGRLFRLLQGIRIDDDTLAGPVIEEVGPMRHFLEHKHTRKFLRQEMLYPRLGSHQNPEVWWTEGAVTISEAAAERVRSLLAALPERNLDETAHSELRRVMQSAVEAQNTGK